MDTKKRSRPLPVGRGGLVCRCHKVYIHTIQEIARNTGEDSLTAVSEQTKATTGCNACHTLVSEIIDEELLITS